VSAAFELLNRVTNCYKSGVKIMMTFGAPRSFRFCLHTLGFNKVEVMRSLEVRATCLP